MQIYRPQAGTPINELDTPCLIIEMDALEHNMNVIAKTYEGKVCKMRQHSKNIKSPVLGLMQIRAGGTNDGVCAAKTAEAEVMVDGGINDILITSQVSTRDKLARIAAMNKRADVKLTVDNEANIRLLSEVAQEQGVTVGVVIEVDTSMHRGGIRAVDHGVKIAKLASSLPGIKFRGVMSHQTLPGNPDRETRFTEGRRYIQMCLDVKDAIEAAGIPVEIVSSGESWTYDVAADIPGVTEVEGGTYFLMGSNYDYMADDFQYASKIMGTVISTPRSGVAIGDVGVRALASPGGVLPRIEGVPGVKVESLLDDHIVLRSEGDMPLKVGDKFFLTSGQQDVMVNRWDEFIAVRNGKVESVIEIPARGCFQ